MNEEHFTWTYLDDVLYMIYPTDDEGKKLTDDLLFLHVPLTEENTAEVEKIIAALSALAESMEMEGEAS